jgi:hypothetical protein
MTILQMALILFIFLWTLRILEEPVRVPVESRRPLR